MATQRRNGQLSSCEPCRKGKLRCDHRLPTCDRCAHRGQVSLCIYHPAPMTRSWPLPKKSEKKVPCRVRKRQTGKSVRDASLSQDAANGVVDNSSSPGLCWNQPASSAQCWLGLTSSQGIFADLEPGLTRATDEETAGAISEDSIPVDPHQVTIGVQVLQLLNDLPLYRTICEARYASLFKPWVFGPPFIEQLFSNIHRLYQQEPSLNDLALKISRESRVPIIVLPDMTFTEYISLIASRWEGIGLLFAITGASIYHIRGEHEIFSSQKDGQPAVEKRSLQSRMAATAEMCIQLCERAGIISEPLSWLQFQQTILVSILWGSTDYRAWKKLGDASTMVFALGLHLTDPEDKNTPFFLAELRRRSMAAGYIVDKELVTVLGRPPRISHRYCDLPLPLDLSYEEIVGDPQTRESALEDLDTNGWNSQGLLSKGAYPRVALLIAKLRENVLEVTSSHQVNGLPQRIKEVYDESQSIRKQLPLFLQWRLIGTLEPSADELTVQSIHLDFLYTEFLLYRTSVKRSGTGNDKLIEIAHEILSTILDRIADVAKPERTVSAMVPVDSSLCYYALPCAGVLAIELFRQYQCSTDASFPRAEVVQKLSIFVFFLETYVPPGQVNYTMSQQARRVIRNILNQVLTPPLPASSSPIPTWMGETGLSGDGSESISWLDTLDWGQDPWWNLT